MLPTLPLKNVTKDIVSTPFKRAQLGLFQGKTRVTGNSVPFSKHKTRRTWLPNVQKKRFFSDTLEKDVTVNVTVRALRTIRKHGGIDTYVKKTDPDLLQWEGLRIRLMLREAEREKARKADEALTPTQRLARITAERRRLERIARKLVDEKEKKPTLQQVKRDRLRATKAMIEETMKVGQVTKIEKLVSAEETIKFLQNKDKVTRLRMALTGRWPEPTVPTPAALPA